MFIQLESTYKKKASNHAVNCYIKHQWLDCNEKGNNIEGFCSLRNLIRGSSCFVAEALEWSPYSTCSVTCGVGKRTRSRMCDGVACPKSGREFETISCYISECPGKCRIKTTPCCFWHLDDFNWQLLMAIKISCEIFFSFISKITMQRRNFSSFRSSTPRIRKVGKSGGIGWVWQRQQRLFGQGSLYRAAQRSLRALCKSRKVGRHPAGGYNIQRQAPYWYNSSVLGKPCRFVSWISLCL